MRSERGSVSVAMVGVLAIAAASVIAATRLGVAAVAKARADAAADAAALAAADMLALGRGPDVAERAARTTAGANGARLERCVCAGRLVKVRVRVAIVGLGDAVATANAEIGGPSFQARDGAPGFSARRVRCRGSPRRALAHWRQR